MAINGGKLRSGQQLEVVDKNRISVVRVATVDHIVGGRIHVRYHGSNSADDGFWCHEKSPLIHPVGWAAMIGHSLRATTRKSSFALTPLFPTNSVDRALMTPPMPEYAKSSLQKALLQKYSENDASWDMFPKVSRQSSLYG